MAELTFWEEHKTETAIAIIVIVVLIVATIYLAVRSGKFLVKKGW